MKEEPTAAAATAARLIDLGIKHDLTDLINEDRRIAIARIIDRHCAPGWQPIDSAPRDGTLIDLWGLEIGASFAPNPKSRRYTDCKYIPPSERWSRGYWWSRSYGTIEASHWKHAPLPPAP